MNLASLLIRLPARSGSDSVATACGALGALAGVARVERSVKLADRLFVHYDPRLVSAQALRDALRRLSLEPTFIGN